MVIHKPCIFQALPDQAPSGDQREGGKRFARNVGPHLRFPFVALAAATHRQYISGARNANNWNGRCVAILCIVMYACTLVELSDYMPASDCTAGSDSVSRRAIPCIVTIPPGYDLPADHFVLFGVHTDHIKLEYNCRIIPCIDNQDHQVVI